MINNFKNFIDFVLSNTMSWSFEKYIKSSKVCYKLQIYESFIKQFIITLWEFQIENASSKF